MRTLRAFFSLSKRCRYVLIPAFLCLAIAYLLGHPATPCLAWDFPPDDPDEIITTIVGTGIPGYDGDGIDPLNARLNYPSDLVWDTTNQALLIFDAFNSRIRRCSPLSR